MSKDNSTGSATTLPDDRPDTARGAGTEDGDGPFAAVTSRASEVIEGAGQLARTLPDQLDRAAETTGRVVEDAQRTLDAGSDAALLMGASLTAGIAVGLLVGRAPRLVVALALLSAAAMSATLAQRRGGVRLDVERPLVN